MMFYDLLRVLQDEYRHITGVWPCRPWYGQNGWLWEPWVGEFLRTYKAPSVALVRRKP